MAMTETGAQVMAADTNIAVTEAAATIMLGGAPGAAVGSVRVAAEVG